MNLIPFHVLYKKPTFYTKLNSFPSLFSKSGFSYKINFVYNMEYSYTLYESTSLLRIFYTYNNVRLTQYN
jgi:hypothetical protein